MVVRSRDGSVASFPVVQVGLLGWAASPWLPLGVGWSAGLQLAVAALPWAVPVCHM